jgi:hypothetical protein
MQFAKVYPLARPEMMYPYRFDVAQMMTYLPANGGLPECTQ